jgi:hypothetical protein
VLQSANKLFLKIRSSLTRCVKLVSRGPPLLALAEVFEKVRRRGVAAGGRCAAAWARRGRGPCCGPCCGRLSGSAQRQLRDSRCPKPVPQPSPSPQLVPRPHAPTPQVLSGYAAELTKRLPRTAAGATSAAPPYTGSEWQIRLSEEEEVVVCHILATAEFCRCGRRCAGALALVPPAGAAGCMLPAGGQRGCRCLSTPPNTPPTTPPPAHPPRPPRRRETTESLAAAITKDIKHALAPQVRRGLAGCAPGAGRRPPARPTHAPAAAHSRPFHHPPLAHHHPLPPQVDFGEQENAFVNVASACMSVLVLGINTRLDAALQEMCRIRWGRRRGASTRPRGCAPGACGSSCAPARAARPRPRPQPSPLTAAAAAAAAQVGHGRAAGRRQRLRQHRAQGGGGAGPGASSAARALPRAPPPLRPPARPPRPQVLLDCAPRLGLELDRTSFSFLCDKMARLFVPRLYDALYR